MSNTQPIQPQAIEAEGAIEALHIPVALIDRDPAQPRTHFDEAALAALAESIRQHGVIQPIEVEETPDGRYRIHHGERRWRASKLAGRETIPAVVAPARAADERLVRQALENLHREDLNPIDEARVYQGLIDHGWARLRIARETGKSLPTINGRLAWLKLEPEIQSLVALGHLSKDGRLAEKLYVLPPEARVPLAEKLARHGLGLQASLRACDRTAEEIARKAEALEEGRRRHAGRAAAVPGANGVGGPGGSPGRNGTVAHPVPLVAYGAGARRAVTATIGAAAEAMCRGCAVRPAGADVIPAWEIVERAAAETCAACARRDGPPIPRVCELCQGAALLGRLVGAVKAQAEETAA
jgi:ParB/RepB/Spo0J family partition protein